MTCSMHSRFRLPRGAGYAKVTRRWLERSRHQGSPVEMWVVADVCKSTSSASRLSSNPTSHAHYQVLSGVPTLLGSAAEHVLCYWCALRGLLASCPVERPFESDGQLLV